MQSSLRQGGDRRVLVIEPDGQRGVEVYGSLTDHRIETRVIHDAETAWKTFTSYRPTHVIAALRGREGKKGGDWFIRRLQSEFMGAMPNLYLTCEPDELTRDLPGDPEAFVTTPIAREALLAILGAGQALPDTPIRQATRLRELYELSLLSTDLLSGLDNLVARANLTFQSADCVVWGSPSEPHWPRMSRILSDSEREELLLWCRRALAVETTVIAARAPTGVTVCDGGAQSFLAAPLGPPGEESIAGICLVVNHARCFSNEERDSLRVLARHLSTELAWMSAHNRLLAEHEKLRQTALLDPLLGVWTRVALEQSIRNQLVTGDEEPAPPMALAVIDFKQLRTVNDRYGHVVGDRVLTHFAATVKSAARPSDQVGRFGGDELAVLMTGLSLVEARTHTQAMIETLRATPFFEGDVEIGIEVRAGLTDVAPTENSGEGAFARALGAIASARRHHVTLYVSDAAARQDAEVTLGLPESLPGGSTLGGMYRILHEISRGAMGVVYRGEDLGLGRQVAIKVLRSDLASDRELVSKFRAEAALLASLRHRNLVQVYSFGTEADDVFFVMELVEGEPLSQIAHRLHQAGSSIDLDAVAEIVEEIADALDAIHSVGIVHRDVKPENILVDRINDRAVLVDVGIAKRPDGVQDAAGTPGFAAPECFMQMDETAATDVYGLAATTYALLTGRPPYVGDEVVQVVNQQLTELPQPPSQVRSDLSPAVDSVLTTALAPEMSQRYSSASAFALALTRALKHEVRPAAEHRRKRPAVTSPIPATDTLVDLLDVSTFRLSRPTATEARTESEFGHTRGALFRVAAVSLGHQLGPDWVEALKKAAPGITEVLSPDLAPLSWHPVEYLLGLLRCAEDHVPAPEALAKSLGRSMMSSTLAHFLGANPSAQTTHSLLKALESFWSKMHSWGSVKVVNQSPTNAVVELHRGPKELLLCALLEGTFARIAELSGASAVTCSSIRCACRGDDLCAFALSWAPARQPA